MPRKKTFQTLREARKTGPYAERPMLPDDIDIQLHLSRNDRPQPFYLICGKDTLLAQMSGRGRVEFKQTSVNHHPMEQGDFIYVPAGAPHRLIPEGETVVFRYRAADAGLEGVAWYCDGCGSEVHREVWDTATTLPQEGYAAASKRFNENQALRQCPDCQQIHAEIDLSPYQWETLAEEIRAEMAG